MRNNPLQFYSMAIFVMGFILASSGWSLVLADGFKSKADWSVCGQDMCSCLPTNAAEPYCPLCVVEDSESANGSTCSDSPAAPSDTPRRVPNTKRFQAASSASHAGCASLFLSFILGSRDRVLTIQMITNRSVIRNDECPNDPLRDLPTPPPRA